LTDITVVSPAAIATASMPLAATTMTKLLSDGQHARPMLCILQPITVFTAELAALPTAIDNSVADLSITKVSGDSSLVKPDMTCLVMNAAETIVKGVARVRKLSTDSVLRLSEDNDDTTIRWVVGCHLVVLHDFGIWPRHIYVPSALTFFMDFDEVYADQHELPDPLIIGGPPIIPVMLLGASVAIPFDFSDSNVPFGIDTITSWAFSVNGTATIADDSTDHPTVTATAAGSYILTATVTTAGAKEWTRYFYIEVYDTSRPPITSFELTSQPEGSADQGGWSFSVRMYAEASKTVIRDRALVALFSRDYYQNVEESLGPLANRENLVSWGWITGETIDWDAEGSTVTFEVRDAQYWLGIAKAWPVGLEDTDFADNGGGNPNRWYEMMDLTVDKALWHFARWRSTVSRVMDVFFTGNTWQAATIESAAGRLWEQLVDWSNSTILAVPAVDRYGRLFISRNQHHVPLDERDAITTIIDLTDEDYHAQVTIQRRIMPKYAQVAISGVYYLDDLSAPIGAYSPGKVPIAPAQEEFSQDELVMGTQDEALEWAGLIGGSGAGEIEYATVVIPRNIRFFDIAPHAWVRIPVAIGDTIRGVNYSTVRLIIRSVRYEFDDDAGAWSTTLECEGEGEQWGAVKMEFPEENQPPVDPPVEPPVDPPLPPLPPPPPPEQIPSDLDAVVACGNTQAIRSTADLDQASPTWSAETA
jgi:hypothetical protein